MSLTVRSSHLLAALPESIWAEANRRLRLIPELWALAEDGAVLEAYCALGGEPLNWRPGPLGLAAYTARHPQCEGNPEAWLMESDLGREQVNAAYTELVSSNVRSSHLHPLDHCLPAALALRLRGDATADWSAIAAEACLRQPDRWRLPLQYLWGLIESPTELFIALLETEPNGSVLAAQCLVVNTTAAEAVDLVKQLNLTLPVQQWLSFIESIKAMGEAALAQAIAKAVAHTPTPPHPHTLTLPHPHTPILYLSSILEHALLLAATEDFALAHPALTEAWAQTQKVGAALSKHIGQLALKANDPASALAGFQDALVVEPDNPELHAGIAKSLLMLNQPEAALSAIKAGSVQNPDSLLISARAHLVLGQREEVQKALRRIEESLGQTVGQDGSLPYPAEQLAEAAHLHAELGNQPDAIRLMKQAAFMARTDASKFLTAALWLSASDNWEAAKEMAIEAAALAPQSAEVREALGRALLACGDAVGAVRHFQSAVVFDPRRLSASLGLSRAALAADQPALARDAAERVLMASSEKEVEGPVLSAVEGPVLSEAEGEAHVLMGQALSALQQDDLAFEHFYRASTLIPSAPEPWRAMANHHLQRGKHEQALATLEAGRQALTLVSSPQVASLLTTLADLYTAVGRQTEAITALREACALLPHSPAEHRRLGKLLREQGYTAEAIDILRRALQLQPGDAQALHELGLALEKQNKLPEAWAAYQQSVLARPTDPQPYFDLGRLTLAQHRKGLVGASPLQAAAALREAVRLAPQNPDGHALLAQAQQLAGQPEGALESYQRALHLDPDRTDWSLGLGQVCLALRRPEAAIAALQDALKHAPHEQTAAVHIALARAYAQSNLWPEAYQSVEAALKLEPDNPALFQLLAEASERLGLPDEALKAWQQAVALNPRDTKMQIRYARCLLDSGEADEARRVYAQALSIGPDSAEVHLAAGQALLELGEVEQAYQALIQATELAPHSAEAQAALGQAAFRADQYETAHAAFLRAAEIETADRTRARYLREAGEALWKMDRTAAAVALWRRAIHLYPEDTQAQTRLGTALVRLGDYTDALAILEKALEQNPHEAATARQAARAALALGELDRAAHHLECVINLQPGDAEARFLLGQVHEQKHEPDKALAHYRQAARLSPGEGRYLAASASALAHLGNLNESVKLIESALAVRSSDPDSAEVQQQAGEIYLRAGQPVSAVSAFERLVAARPRDPEAHLSLAKALTILAERQEHEIRTGLTTETSVQSVDPSLQQAAALGADPQTVRYWMGRAKAVSGDPKEAQKLLSSLSSSVQSVDLQSVDLHRALGAALRKSGHLERARESLQAALEQQPDNRQQAFIYLELGLTHAAMTDRSGAVTAFQKAVAADPNWAVAYYYLAEVLLALGQRNEAAQVLQHALTLQPGAAAWHHRLGKIYQAQHDPASTLAHFQRAAELDPGNPGYATDLARALARDGDLDAAADFFRRATDANPYDSELWAERGQLHLALGDLNCASTCFTRAAELDPASVAAHLGGARVSLALGNLHDAVNKAEAAARLSPDDTEALICLADIQAAQGDTTKAEANYLAAAGKTKDSAPALLALGRLYAAQRKHVKAVETLERAAAANPESDEIFATLGDVCYDAGDHTSSLAAYREAVRISPRNAKHLLRLGRACRAQGQLDQALAHLLQAREFAPGDDEVLRETGLVFETRKQYDRALEMYQFAIRAAPNVPINYYHAGAALKQLKDYAGAVSALERAVALDPKNLEATKQLAVVSALNLMHGEQRVRV